MLLTIAPNHQIPLEMPTICQEQPIQLNCRILEHIYLTYLLTLMFSKQSLETAAVEEAQEVIFENQWYQMKLMNKLWLNNHTCKK